MKISGFVLTTNAVQFQFPFIESIKSFLPIVDELIVVDGGSTDGTVRMIEEIGSPKIRIVQNNDTLWEDEWMYWRMGHNFNRALEECTGDWVIKFDADYILHEEGTKKCRDELEKAFKNGVMALAFTRKNFILSDRYFIKSKKTLGVNITECKKRGICVKYGLDIKGWHWGFDFVSFAGEKYKVNTGTMIRHSGNTTIPSLTIHNYDYLFMTKKVARNARHRHFIAEQRQRQMMGAECLTISTDTGIAWGYYKDQCVGNMSRKNYAMSLSEHPLVIRDKIKTLPNDRQGYDCWGLIGNKSKYYG